MKMSTSNYSALVIIFDNRYKIVDMINLNVPLSVGKRKETSHLYPNRALTEMTSMLDLAK